MWYLVVFGAGGVFGLIIGALLNAINDDKTDKPA